MRDFRQKGILHASCCIRPGYGRIYGYRAIVSSLSDMCYAGCRDGPANDMADFYRFLELADITSALSGAALAVRYLKKE